MRSILIGSRSEVGFLERLVMAGRSKMTITWKEVAAFSGVILLGLLAYFGNEIYQDVKTLTQKSVQSEKDLGTVRKAFIVLVRDLNLDPEKYKDLLSVNVSPIHTDKVVTVSDATSQDILTSLNWGKAVEIQTLPNSQVFAVDEGIVIDSKSVMIPVGNVMQPFRQVSIDHRYGIVTDYALAESNVNVGDVVSKEQVIGSTSSAPLFFRVRMNDKPMPPLSSLQKQGRGTSEKKSLEEIPSSGKVESGTPSQFQPLKNQGTITPPSPLKK